MNPVRFLILEPENYSPVALDLYQSIGTVDFGPLPRQELIARLPDYDVLVIRLCETIDREVLDAARKPLKVIVSPTTGLDHIDLQAAQEKGIAVLSLRGQTDFLRSIPATAELTWGLLLALVRRIPQAFASVRGGAWDRDLFRGHDLAGQTLGILGLGRVGEKVAQYALAFGMRVMAYDPFRSEWLPGVDRGASMEHVLEQAQALSIHVPLLPETARLIAAEELSLLPGGALLLNTARGDVLDEDALVDALLSGHLGGAALDVISHERGKPNPRLLGYARQHDNLLITPHIGGATYESMAATEIFMANQLKTFLADAPLG